MCLWFYTVINASAGKYVISRFIELKGKGQEQLGKLVQKKNFLFLQMVRGVFEESENTIREAENVRPPSTHRPISKY